MKGAIDMQWTVALNNTSFDRAGITKDCQEAICEYIWNSFEAEATEVEVSFTGSPLEEAISLQVKDNGQGIIFENLNETFAAFLFSIKNSASIRIKSQANKGKGRFSYLCFSHSADWSTVYKQGESLKKYSISTNSVSISDFTTSDVIDVTDDTSTGTIVRFPLSESLLTDQLAFSRIQQKLLQEFSWFLYLNKSKNLTLKYEGISLDYGQHIDSELSAESDIAIMGEFFHIQLIVWKKKIDNSSKVYYLSEKGEIHAAFNTGFNKNTVDFYHNVFVTSKYINEQNTYFLNDSETIYTLADQGKRREVFKVLKQEISRLITEALKNFLVHQADKRLMDMEERGSLPTFSQDEYGQLRKRDFEKVTRELYCVEPRIFHKLTDLQEKSLLGFMNLLLVTEERENLLDIVEQVVSLTTEQRKDFAEILHRTHLQYIIEAIGIIEKRMSIIKQLKQIVYDLTQFANERDHIQKIIEQHFWLFGEQYHMLTADKTLGRSLAEFEKTTETQSRVKKKTMSKGESRQRVDVFLYTQRIREDSSSEMIVVELKAPNIKLSQKVFGQIVRYANTIRKEERFNGLNRIWRFYAVCASVDDDVKTKYDNFKQYGRLGLADIIGNFEIYALSWDDVFQAFEARHDFLLSRLKLDLTQIVELESNTAEEPPSRELVNQLTQELISIGASG